MSVCVCMLAKLRHFPEKIANRSVCGIEHQQINILYGWRVINMEIVVISYT